jgi:hypothetical protein
MLWIVPVGCNDAERQEGVQPQTYIALIFGTSIPAADDLSFAGRIDVASAPQCAPKARRDGALKMANLRVVDDYRDCMVIVGVGGLGQKDGGTEPLVAAPRPSARYLLQNLLVERGANDAKTKSAVADDDASPPWPGQPAKQTHAPAPFAARM